MSATVIRLDEHRVPRSVHNAALLVWRTKEALSEARDAHNRSMRLLREACDLAGIDPAEITINGFTAEAFVPPPKRR